MEGVKVTYDRTTLLIAVSVGIWWTANSITAGFSKSLMQGDYKNFWGGASLDLRWFELSALQHLIGAIVSIIWLKIVMRKSVWPANASKRIILYASLGNVAGNMATNAAYAVVSSSLTQVMKAGEPLFMFVLSLILYRDYKALNFTTLSGVVFIVIGVILFVAYDSILTVSGLLAALCSNVAFPIRNIYLKKLSSVWESSFQKYAVISSYSVLILAPLVLAKVILFQSVALIKKWQEGLISSSFHCTYNLASIYVLQNFTPLTHAILNHLKRGIVIVFNLLYFQLPVSWKMVIGLIAVLAGLFIYLYRNLKGEKFNPPSVVLVLITVALGLLFFAPSDSVKGLTVSQSYFSVHNKLGPFSNVDTPHIQSADYVMAQPSAVSLHSAWVYDQPVSREILSNIQSLAALGPVTFYCGTSHCVQALNHLSNRNITATFLILPQLVENSPFEEWLANHPVHKLFAFDSFENHLQEVVRLSVLWKYGGLYIEPNVQLKPQQSFPSCSSDPWVGKQTPTDSVQHFDIACFPEQNKFIEKLSDTFSKKYFTSYKSKSTMLQLDEGTWKSDFSSLDLPRVIQVDYQTLSLETDQPWNHHYGTLTYNTRVNYMLGANVGDEVQSYPGLQFLPFIDNFLDRDALTDNRNNDQHITAFFNAWWESGFAKWPPQSNIDPLLMSVHVNKPMARMWEEHVDYLLPRAPVGCRDSGTLSMFQKINVPAYFSGCMTLTLQVKSKRTDEIFIVDVSEEFRKMIPEAIRKKASYYSHLALAPWSFTFIRGARFEEAYKAIQQYSRAKLVITQRIHVALPCVAMGTPVMFVDAKWMPGGGGARTGGLTGMFHTVDKSVNGKDSLANFIANFPYDNPPPNPNMATMMRLRATFWYQIRKRPTLVDASYKFGVVPMSPPSPCVDSVPFHTIFPRPDKHFTWQDHRSIESIFRYYPCASIVVHSNTLDDTRFDVFRESGYTIQTKTYDLASLYKDISLTLQTQDKLVNIKDQSYLALVLYKWGGIYMDLNIILTKSLDDLPRNFVVWADPSKEEVDASFMRFEKGSKFLELVISKLAADPDHQRDSIYTQSVKEFKGDVSMLDSSTVFVFDKNQVGKQCYEVTSGSEYNSLKKTIADSAVAVALLSDHSLIKTTPLKADTLCKMLLNDHCVICCEIL